jgi:hypothetical protein
MLDQQRCQANVTSTSINKVMCDGELTIKSVKNYISDGWRRRACLVRQRLTPKRGAVVMCSNFWLKSD